MRLRKIWESLFRATKRRPMRSMRLGVECLEDRCVLSGTGLVSGILYLDANASGAFDSFDRGLNGVSVSLVGTGVGNASVNLTATSDSSGQYSFRSLDAGPYQLTAGPVAALVNPTQTAQANINLANGQALTNQNLAFSGGVAPQSIGLGLLLNTGGIANFSFGASGPSADNAPTISAALGTVTLPENTTGKIIDLAGFFSDPDYTNSQVKFNLFVSGSAQSMTVDTFDALAPQTVANFFNYVNAGDYNNVFFNRKTTTGVDGISVLQGGAVTVDASGTVIDLVPIGPTILNEFGLSNTLGTLAMAQKSGDADSATNQFFFNTANNSTQLDAQSFTVFGEVADAASQTTLTSLAGTPTHNLTNATLTHDFPPAGFAQVPLNAYAGSAATFPGDANLSNYLVITSIDVLKRDEFLTYALVSNSNAALVSTAFDNEFLTLNAAAGQTGSASIVVRATDRFGLSVDQTLTVQINAAPVVTAVTITPDTPAVVTILTANPTATGLTGNANPVTFTYQWLQNGFPILNATNQTLNVATLPTVKVGDTFSVEVTPHQLDGAATVNGAKFTSSPRTVATASPDPITLVP